MTLIFSAELFNRRWYNASGTTKVPTLFANPMGFVRLVWTTVTSAVSELPIANDRLRRGPAAHNQDDILSGYIHRQTVPEAQCLFPAVPIEIGSLADWYTQIRGFCLYLRSHCTLMAGFPSWLLFSQWSSHNIDRYFLPKQQTKPSMINCAVLHFLPDILPRTEWSLKSLIWIPDWKHSCSKNSNRPSGKQNQ